MEGRTHRQAMGQEGSTPEPLRPPSRICIHRSHGRSRPQPPPFMVRVGPGGVWGTFSPGAVAPELRVLFAALTTLWLGWNVLLHFD